MPKRILDIKIVTRNGVDAEKVAKMVRDHARAPEGLLFELVDEVETRVGYYSDTVDTSRIRSQLETDLRTMGIKEGGR